MSKRAFSRSFDMPTVDPDKEDEHVAYEGTKGFKAPEKGDCGNAFEKATGELIRKWLDKGFEDIEDIYEREYNCPVVAKSCDHKWKSYTGLSEQFEYCEICDERK